MSRRAAGTRTVRTRRVAMALAGRADASLATRAQRLARATADAYAHDAYGTHEWLRCATLLLTLGHSDAVAEEILRSKYPRWAATGPTPTSADLGRLLVASPWPTTATSRRTIGALTAPAVTPSPDALATLAAAHAQTFPASVLAAAARGALDLNAIARHELGSRGLNHDGLWVGFDKARVLAKMRPVRSAAGTVMVAVPDDDDDTPAATPATPAAPRAARGPRPAHVYADRIAAARAWLRVARTAGRVTVLGGGWWQIAGFGKPLQGFVALAQRLIVTRRITVDADGTARLTE